jgi:hypothetical protein
MSLQRRLRFYQTPSPPKSHTRLTRSAQSPITIRALTHSFVFGIFWPGASWPRLTASRGSIDTLFGPLPSLPSPPLILGCNVDRIG